MLVDLHNLCFCFLFSYFVFEFKSRPIFVTVGSCFWEILLSWLFLCMWHHCSFNLITKLSPMYIVCPWSVHTKPWIHILIEHIFPPRHHVIFSPFMLLQVDTKHLGHKFSFWTSLLHWNKFHLVRTCPMATF
jgi:hypothetical protein